MQYLISSQSTYSLEIFLNNRECLGHLSRELELEQLIVCMFLPYCLSLVRCGVCPVITFLTCMFSHTNCNYFHFCIIWCASHSFPHLMHRLLICCQPASSLAEMYWLAERLELCVALYGLVFLHVHINILAFCLSVKCHSVVIAL